MLGIEAVRGGRREVVRNDLEHLQLSVSMTVEQKAAIERHVEPLMRVRRNGVRLLHASQQMSMAARQSGEYSECRIHVKVRSMPAGRIAHGNEIIEITGSDRACVADDNHRLTAQLGQTLLQRRQIDS